MYYFCIHFLREGLLPQPGCALLLNICSRDEVREVAEDQPPFIKGHGSHMGFRQGSDPSAFQMMDHLEIMVGL